MRFSSPRRSFSDELDIGSTQKCRAGVDLAAGFVVAIAPMKISHGALVIPLLALGACQQSEGLPSREPPPPPQAAPPQAAPPQAAPSAPQGANAEMAGTVIETMDSGGYTYVQIEAGPKGRVWAAGPSTQVQVGDTVSIGSGMLMQGFVSNTLNRTFDEIYFANSIRVEGGGGSTAQVAKPTDGPSSRPSAPPASVEVPKAEGGYTVAEVFAQADELAGQEVLLRGEVVKYNAGIMGKNWLHVRDGSGAAGTNDLTVTTDGTASVGDVLLIRGKLSTNKDFGAGYSYSVIIEDATLAK